MDKQIVKVDISELMFQLSERVGVAGDLCISEVLKALAMATQQQDKEES